MVRGAGVGCGGEVGDGCVAGGGGRCARGVVCGVVLCGVVFCCAGWLCGCVVVRCGGLAALGVGVGWTLAWGRRPGGGGLHIMSIFFVADLPAKAVRLEASGYDIFRNIFR